MGKMLGYLQKHFVPSPRAIIEALLIVLLTTGGAGYWAIQQAMQGPYVILLVVAVAGMTLFAINQYRKVFEEHIEPLTPDELCRQIRDWLYNYRYIVQDEPGPEVLFRMRLIIPFGRGFSISVSGARPSMLFFDCHIDFDSSITQWAQTTPHQENVIRLVADMRQALSMYGLSWNNLNPMFQPFSVWCTLPLINGRVDEYTFIQKVSYMERGVDLPFNFMARLPDYGFVPPQPPPGGPPQRPPHLQNL